MTRPLPPPGLRRAHDDDAYDLIGLVAACWADYPGCVLDVHGEMAHLLAVATTYEGLGGAAWVVEDDAGRLAASVAVEPAGDEGAELKMLYVAPRARRRGLGATLVGMIEAEVQHQHKSYVHLWSDTRFADAHRLYERLGYARQPETRDLHDLSHTTELHYRKDLVRPER